MHPIAFEIFDYPVRWYGVMAALGFLTAITILQWKRNYANVSKEQISDIAFVAIVTGIIGSRITYVIRFWDTQFKNNFWSVFRIDQGGLVFYGGFILATIVLIVYCKRKKLEALRILDIFAPAMAIGHALGRIGCFLNGCCYGGLCKIQSLGVTYPEGSQTVPPEFTGIPLHPVQLYETIENLILAGILLLLIKKVKVGQTAAIYLASYGILRFCNEFCRADHHSVDMIFGLTPAQIKSLFLVPIGVIWFIYLQKKQSK